MIDQLHLSIVGIVVLVAILVITILLFIVVARLNQEFCKKNICEGCSIFSSHICEAI